MSDGVDNRGPGARNDGADPSAEAVPAVELPVAEPSRPTARTAALRPSWLPEWFLPPAGPNDKYAHRRGEPRLFVFLWTLFLLLATVWMFWRVLSGGVPSLEVYRSGAQTLLVTMAVGACVLWPVVRLCQVPPRGSGLRPIAADIIAVLVPAQAVIVPQWLLAQWSVGVLIAVSLVVGAWVVLAGAVIVSAWRLPPAFRAVAAMVIVAGVSLGPAVGMVARAMSGSGGLGMWAMSSPMTAMVVLTDAERTDVRRGVVSAEQWGCIAGAWGAAGLAWAVAGIIGRLRRSEPERTG